MSSPDDVPPLSGFTLIKNATRREYPVEAVLRTLRRVCDEVVVNVGESEDDTLERVRAAAEEEAAAGPAGASGEGPAPGGSADVPTRAGPDEGGPTGADGSTHLDGRTDADVRILRRRWPEEFDNHLKELSDESNRALEACEHDWALYLQADELLHEDDVPALRRALARADADGRAEGLLFDFLHFHGSPEWVLEGRRRYRREVRLVRRGAGVRSVRDAQGFRVGGEGGRKPRVLRSGARVFHYGYVKSREGLDRKRRLWRRWFGEDAGEDVSFTFYRYRGLRRFDGEHPEAIRPWLAERTWAFDPDEAEPPPRNLRTLKVRISDAIERRTGHRLFEHRNYRLLR